MSSYKMSQKVLNPKAPDRGSFPLDHDGECRQFMVRYMTCLRQHEMNTHPCRALARDYLKCRMDKGLMAPEQWSKLGFTDSDGAADSPAAAPAPAGKAAGTKQ